MRNTGRRTHRLGKYVKYVRRVGNDSTSCSRVVASISNNNPIHSEEAERILETEMVVMCTLFFMFQEFIRKGMLCILGSLHNPGISHGIGKIFVALFRKFFSACLTLRYVELPS